MRDPSDERNDESPADERLVEAVRGHWTPPPLSPARRTALRATIEARLEERSRPWLLMPALGGALAAGLAVWLLFAPSPPITGPQSEAALLAWEEEVLFAAEVLEEESVLDTELLPDDYVAISALLLDT